nr:hypothetical protein [Desulfobacula sp.]
MGSPRHGHGYGYHYRRTGGSPEASYAGGHTKIGELIAKAVHAGVTEAVSLQNGNQGGPGPVSKIMAERKLDLEQILELFPVKSGGKIPVSRLESVLMTPYYASFLESALAVSNEYQKGLVKDLAFFDDMCASVTARLAGKTGIPPREAVSGGLPIVMAKAFGALVAGITEQHY